jgi:N-acyl-D-aspartate/D-glutamate deacylase
MDLLGETRLDVTMIDHYATEETVRTIFRHPLYLVGSDGIFGDRPHPRLYGTAARVLGRYALKERLTGERFRCVERDTRGMAALGGEWSTGHSRSNGTCPR